VSVIGKTLERVAVKRTRHIAGGTITPRVTKTTKPMAPPTDQAQPPQRAEKVGRNSPCLCGSGLKWKKCCGR
jgi:hypothetical protein